MSNHQQMSVEEAVEPPSDLAQALNPVVNQDEEAAEPPSDLTQAQALALNASANKDEEVLQNNFVYFWNFPRFVETLYFYNALQNVVFFHEINEIRSESRKTEKRCAPRASRANVNAGAPHATSRISFTADCERVENTKRRRRACAAAVTARVEVSCIRVNIVFEQWPRTTIASRVRRRPRRVDDRRPTIGMHPTIPITKLSKMVNTMHCYFSRLSEKVATKVSDLIPQNSWISKWFNNSHDEEELQASEDNDQYQDKLSQPPPSKRPCIRMDVTHPPGTFSIKRTNRNLAKAEKESKEQQSNHNDTNLQAPKRTSVQVKPSENKSEMDSSVMSHTARKILETLEQFSSPLTDAKKMPVRNIMSPSVSRKRAREEETSTPKIGLRHLTRELNVPTVPDILRLRRKQRLQNTTANARKIMNARSNSGLLPATQEYHLRIDEEVEEEKEMPQRNLLKAKKKSKLDEEETVEAVNLPSVALPITNLPRFDFALPQSTKPSTPSAPAKSLEPATVYKPSTPQNRLQNKDDSFQFASPIKFNENAKNLETINDFTFSKPITPSKMTSGNVSMNESHELSRTLSVESNDTMNRTSSFPNFMWTAPTSTTIKMKEKDNRFEEKKSSPMPKVASELKKGASVMDYFAQKPVVVEEDTDRWECNECLIKNSGKSTNCTSCKSPRHRQDSSDDIEIIDGSDDDGSGFGDMFKKPEGTWNCDTCMVPNKANDVTCAACQTPKPGAAPASNTTSMPTIKSSFGDQFKKPEGTWTCDTCMVPNKPDVSKCISCETPKPGSSTSKSNLQFKCDMPANAGSFKFGVDKADASPGKASSALPKTNGFSFGNTSSTPAPATGFSFGIPSTKKDETPDTVQFGIKPANDKEAEKSNTTGGFSFGAPKSDAPKPAESGFVFGATSSTEKKEEKTDSTTTVKPASTGFSFGTSTPAAVPAVSLSNDTSANKETPPSTQSTTLPTANFMFNPPKSTTLSVTLKENETTKSIEAKEEPAKPVLNFGGPTTTDSPKPAMPQFSFDSNAKNENNTSTASFNFSAQPKPSETGFGGIKPFSFGQSAEKTTPQNETKTPTLTFGNAGATAATPNFSAPTSKESLPSLFGNATPAASSTETKQPMFGSTENKTIPSFGSTPSQPESKLPAFGSTSDKPASGGFAATFNAQPSTTPSLFGNANPLNTTVSAAPSFGSTNTSTTTGMFGGPAKPADTSAPTPALVPRQLHHHSHLTRQLKPTDLVKLLPKILCSAAQQLQILSLARLQQALASILVAPAHQQQTAVSTSVVYVYLY
ncbi:unnamed protein product [Trichogramma brassicae]|uniref:Nuclear pore complex protein Nup153 n=1 Tax=Trichogramma brassicae TaxID=86971 RepID=A0A6H5HYY4_9HYME|nr:unnamed protein product [Trichogramma brassicae]